MILVIEDSEDLCMMLERMAYTGTVVKDAEAGMELLKSKSVTAVFCDVHGIEKAGLTAHDIVTFCAATGVLCFITSNDIRAQEEFLAVHQVISVDKHQTYRALCGMKGVA